MTHDEMIAVIQAHKEGKALQARSKTPTASWCEASIPDFNFYDYDYRIKPQPFECWVNVYYGEGIMSFRSKSEALTYSKEASLAAIHMREVLP